MSNPSPFVGLLDRVEWKPCTAVPVTGGDGLPYATHEGTLVLGPYSIHVYQLSDGKRVFSEESIKAVFGEIEG